MTYKTTTIEKIVESIVYQKTGKTKWEFENFDDLIKIAIPNIFEDYPIFDEKYREELNLKILRHYFFREIIVTPFGKWKMFFNNTLKEKMPYFNELYKSSLLDYEILENVNITETMDRDLSGKQKHQNIKKENINDLKDEESNRDLEDKLIGKQNQEGITESDTKQVYEDTPFSNIRNEDFATNITEEKDKSKATNNLTENNEQKQLIKDTRKTNNKLSSDLVSDNSTETSNSEDYVKTIIGKNNAKSNSDLIMDFRKSLINIDEMVIKALGENFNAYYY